MTEQGLVAAKVELGRDTRNRPHRRQWWPPWKRKYLCLCCDRFTLNSVDYCDICPECGWEDWYECHDQPDKAIRPNYTSLNVARDIARRFGPAAAHQVNRPKGMTAGEIELLSAAELSRLKTPREEVEAHHA